MSEDRRQPAPGSVVVLNGASSSGKTTVARATRHAAGENCTVVSIDQLYASLHPGRPNDWASFHGLTKVFFATVRAFALNGFDVVADTVFERRECVEACMRKTQDLSPVLVGLVCPVEVLDARERQRTDRPLGFARQQAPRIHDFCSYDLTLDTSLDAPEACAEKILGLLAQRKALGRGP